MAYHRATMNSDSDGWHGVVYVYNTSTNRQVCSPIEAIVDYDMDSLMEPLGDEIYLVSHLILQDLYTKNLAKALPQLQEYGIEVGNTGYLAYYTPTYRLGPGNDTVTVSQFAPSTAKPPTSFTLLLNTYKNNVPDNSYKAQPCYSTDPLYSCKLLLKTAHTPYATIHETNAFNKAPACVRGYNIGSVYIYGSRVVTFINYTQDGYEGSNVRQLVVCAQVHD